MDPLSLERIISMGSFHPFPSAGVWCKNHSWKTLLFSNLKLERVGVVRATRRYRLKITLAAFASPQVSGNTSYPLLGAGPYPPGTTFSRLANPDIQWEVSTQTNVGLDFGLFHDGLTGTLDIFNKVSNDILLQVIPADPVQPAGTFWTNVHDMKIFNKGFEVSFEPVRTLKAVLDIHWVVMWALSTMRLKQPYSVIQSGSASGAGLTSATVNGYINDQPIGTFFQRIYWYRRKRTQ